jgi:hypothetical protein
VDELRPGSPKQLLMRATAHVHREPIDTARHDGGLLGLGGQQATDGRSAPAGSGKQFLLLCEGMG